MNDNDTLADDLRKDSLALMKLLADEKHKSEALAAALRSIAMATEQGALYESAAIHNTALQALRATAETKGEPNEG